MDARKTTAADAEPASMLATRIVHAALREESSIDELGMLATADPAFAMRILQVVNSPAFSLGRRITDMKHAISLLGRRALRNVALGFSVTDMIPTGADGEVLLSICLRRAVAARLVAERFGVKRPDEAFLAGLFLEVGILARARNDLKGAADVARSPAESRVVRERAEGDADHVMRGVEMARKWDLGDDLVEAIEMHHAATAPGGSMLARIAWSAERLAAVFEGGDLAAVRARAMSSSESVGLNGAAADAILRAIPKEVAATATSFQRSVGRQPDLDALLRDANATLVELNRSYEQLVKQLETLIAEKETLAEQLRTANDRLRQLAATDELTGLANHRAFQEALARDLSRASRSGKPLSLVLVDIDFFKRVNDTFGHLGGDAVLRAISKIVAGSLRRGDIAARYGGEELAVILPETPAQNARIVAERLRNAIADALVPAPETGAPMRVTASLGVASSHDGACDEQARADIVARADAALYSAKRSGRNKVVIES